MWLGWPYVVYVNTGDMGGGRGGAREVSVRMHTGVIAAKNQFLGVAPMVKIYYITKKIKFTRGPVHPAACTYIRP